MAAAVGVLLVAATGSCSSSEQASEPIKSQADLVARGSYLVSISGCHDCHTPFKLGPQGPEPDMERALSGHPEGLQLTAPAALPEGWAWAGAATNTAFAGPWGVSYAPNLTPDLETGLAVYTEKSFIQALRTGRHMGVGRPILPPMPWTAYREMTQQDLRAVFAYLSTVKAVRNQAPQAQPAQQVLASATPPRP